MELSRQYIVFKERKPSFSAPKSCYSEFYHICHSECDFARSGSMMVISSQANLAKETWEWWLADTEMRMGMWIYRCPVLEGFGTKKKNAWPDRNGKSCRNWKLLFYVVGNTCDWVNILDDCCHALSTMLHCSGCVSVGPSLRTLSPSPQKKYS